MSTPHFPADISASLRQLLDGTTSGPTPSIAGLVYSAIDRNGEVLFQHASGSRGIAPFNKDKMSLDTVFWIASCTKMITGIACMQLVEQGKLSLDDVEQVEKIAPELKEVKVLEGDSKTGFRLVDKQRGITLRMLLNHTAGFSYSFNHIQLYEYSLPIGFNELSGDKEDVLGLPLVNQPGTKFQYGPNIDWAGILVERVTGLSLEQYFQTHIFQPLGIKDITFFPGRNMKRRLAFMHQRDEQGKLRVVDHVYQFPLMERKKETDEIWPSGGGGCFGTVEEYCKIIAVLLNNGTCPKTKTQILKPETIDEMYKDQIKSIPRLINKPSISTKPQYTKHDYLQPLPPHSTEPQTEGWGLTFALNHELKNSGRKPGSAAWSGMPNLYWWADRESGVGGIIGSQILPSGDDVVLGVNEAAEKLIYTGLKRTEEMHK